MTVGSHFSPLPHFSAPLFSESHVAPAGLQFPSWLASSSSFSSFYLLKLPPKCQPAKASHIWFPDDTWSPAMDPQTAQVVKGCGRYLAQVCAHPSLWKCPGSSKHSTIQSLDGCKAQRPLYAVRYYAWGARAITGGYASRELGLET